jgi:PBP1b-binding outer membrane lipoprotein LpoB
MRKFWAILFLFSILFLAGCAAKKKPVAPPQPAAPPPAPAPVRSQMPPPSAEVIEHCVVNKQENANTVTCRCEPVTTRIDSKTGHTVIVCKKMPEKR